MPTNSNGVYFMVFLPMSLTFWGVVLYTILIVKFIKKEEMIMSNKFIIRAVIAYPIIMLIVWTPVFIDVVLEIVLGRQLFWIYLFRIIISHSQGFLDAFYFVFVGTS